MAISYLTNSQANVDFVNNSNGFDENDDTVRSAADMNFENFLKLLVTELENQDPLNPMDNKEMTAQLAQFSSLEQNIEQNEHLAKIAGQTDYSQQTVALSYIGKEALIPGSDVINDIGSAEATLNYVVPSAVTNVSVEIINSKGEVVRNMEGDIFIGRNSVKWDGTDDAGNPVESGFYSFRASGVDPSGDSVPITEYAYGHVYSVEGTGENMMFTSADGRNFVMDDILQVREAYQPVTTVDQGGDADASEQEQEPEEQA
ncbi:MAG: flagellar hook capping FlgD N-terminal domain-containing protein [Pseudomonadota bacterium]|nr:flagellar hook capping FlgD N-terminal domain-containing protein [Pseudomonadota bacterium]